MKYINKFFLIGLTAFFTLSLLCVQKDIHQAGILPYAFHEGKAYVLLGLEYRSHDRGAGWVTNMNPKTYWVWLDFGGKCDSKDSIKAKEIFTANKKPISYLYYCALREGAEETAYFFGNDGDITGLSLSELLENSVKYFVKKNPKPKAILAANKQYYLYFVEVDFINTNDIQQQAQAFQGAKKGVPQVEKTEWLWVDIEELLETLKKGPDEKGFYRLKSVSKEAKQTDADKLYPPFASTLKLDFTQNHLNGLIDTARKRADKGKSSGSTKSPGKQPQKTTVPTQTTTTSTSTVVKPPPLPERQKNIPSVSLTDLLGQYKKLSDVLQQMLSTL